MNVIVSNKYRDVLATLDIDVIKTINGEFSVDDIIETFSNFFFNKMLLDITALKDYKQIATIQKLSVNLDMSKVILLLDNSPETQAPDYLSQLVSMGIYNFTATPDNLIYLINNPNSYKDVAHLQQVNGPVGQAQGNYNNQMTNIPSGAPSPSQNGNVVIGIKNVTPHAGATTLTYMLYKQLQNKYNVKAVEIDSKDMELFDDPNLSSIPSDALASTIVTYSGYEVVLIDLNNSDLLNYCNDIIYLIEPTTIKLNGLVRKDRNIFQKLDGKKIVLNKSLLDNKDLIEFEYEAKTKIFYNLPPLDDKIPYHPHLENLINKLDIEGHGVSGSESVEEPKKRGLFG